MASKTIRGIVIEIDGNTEGLAKSLKDVNSKISETNAALSKVNKALKLDPNNVEALKQKQDLLNKSIEATKEKLDLEQQAAEKAKEALKLGTITQGEYDNLQAEVQLTASRLNSLEDEADKTGKRLEELGADSTDAAKDIDKVGDEAKDTGDKAKNAGDDFEKFGNAAKIAAEAAAAAFAAVVAAIGAATTALAECTLQAAEYSDNILTLSSVTGLSTDTLQSFSYASELLDVSVDTVAGSLKKCTKSMADAKDGTGAAYEAFEQLGISVTDANGNLRDSEDVFFEAVDALGQIENQTERDALSMAIFGKSATDLNPLIEAGTDTFKEYAAEAESAGAVLSGDVLDDFAEFDDTMQRLEGGASAAQNALGTILLPVLNDLAGEGVDLLAEFTNGVLDADGDVGKFTDLLSDLIPKAVDVVMAELPEVVELGGSVISAILSGLVSNIDVILDAAGEVINTVLFDCLPVLISGAFSILSKLADYLSNTANVKALADGLVKMIADLVKQIGVILPVLLPAVVNVVKEVALAISEPSNMMMIIEAVLTVIGGVVMALAESVPVILDYIVGLINNIIGQWTLLFDWLAPNFDAGLKVILDAFNNVGGALLSGLQTFCGDFINNVVAWFNDLNAFMSSVLSGVLAWFSNIYDTWVTWELDVIDSIVSWFSDLVENVMSFGGDIYDAFIEITDSIKDTIKGAIDGALTWGGDLIENFIDGILNACPALKDTVDYVAGLVDDYIGFSVPEKGALADFDKSGGDMIDLFVSGMRKQMPTLQSAVNSMSATIAGASPNDYTAQLTAINGTLAGLGNVQIVSPVYIGGELIANEINNINAQQNFISGGRS